MVKEEIRQLPFSATTNLLQVQINKQCTLNSYDKAERKLCNSRTDMHMNVKLGGGLIMITWLDIATIQDQTANGQGHTSH